MKRVLLVILTVLMVVMGASFCFAADGTGKFSVGLKAGAGIPTESGEDTGFGLIGDVYYGINKYIDLGIESGWQRLDWGSIGDVDIFPLLFNVKLKASDWINDKFTPYLVTGLGVGFFNVNESSGYTINIDPGFAMKLGGGVEYLITNNLAIDVEASWVYIASDYDADYQDSTTTAHISGSGHEDYVFIGAGLRYQF